MIKNELQYRITKNQLEKFDVAIAKLKGEAMPTDENGKLLRQVMLDGMESQADDLREQIRDYTDLQSGQAVFPIFDDLVNFGHNLIRARIICGLTHQQLADLLECHNQEVQRREATDYESVSLGRAKATAMILSAYYRENCADKEQPCEFP